MTTANGGREDEQRPGVHIGHAPNSAFAFGKGGSATVNNAPDTGQGAVTQQELLQAVRELRADLGRFVATEATEVLEGELVSTEDEITASGSADRGRLVRLRDSLLTAGGLVSGLASGLAVSESVSALLRG
ncbi:hypothetical protein [Streptomyces sp. NPDC020965]|uniref:hypothetical protein n=1 Tax=Streptomyces sp. NPDC020965 TaxID=3365105 RepID=UPI0037AFE03A